MTPTTKAAKTPVTQTIYSKHQADILARKLWGRHAYATRLQRENPDERCAVGFLDVDMKSGKAEPVIKGQGRTWDAAFKNAEIRRREGLVDDTGPQVQVYEPARGFWARRSPVFWAGVVMVVMGGMLLALAHLG